jgi:hypothetical protein
VIPITGDLMNMVVVEGLEDDGMALVEVTTKVEEDAATEVEVMEVDMKIEAGVVTRTEEVDKAEMIKDGEDLF